MSSYGMCPYVFCILHSTRFWFKRRGFAVINIDIISYLVVKSFRPCWVNPVGWLIRCHGSVSVVNVSSGPSVTPTCRWEEMKRGWGPK